MYTQLFAVILASFKKVLLNSAAFSLFLDCLQHLHATISCVCFTDGSIVVTLPRHVRLISLFFHFPHSHASAHSYCSIDKGSPWKLRNVPIFFEYSFLKHFFYVKGKRKRKKLLKKQESSKQNCLLNQSKPKQKLKKTERERSKGEKNKSGENVKR